MDQFLEIIFSFKNLKISILLPLPGGRPLGEPLLPAVEVPPKAFRKTFADETVRAFGVNVFCRGIPGMLKRAADVFIWS